jgi:DNA-binding transcriptional ArsR family regulator
VSIADYILEDVSRDQVLTYREQIPHLLVLNVDDFKAMRKGVRKFIIQILGEGLRDNLEGNDLQRYVLTADEILEALSEKDETIKLPSLYYHLQELEKLGVVNRVIELKKIEEGRTGRSYKTFYGRSAKIFMIGNSIKEKEELEILKNDQFHRFLQDISGKTGDEVDSVMDKLLRIEHNPIDDLAAWLDKYADKVSEYDFGIAQLLILMGFLRIQDKELVDGIAEFRGILDL